MSDQANSIEQALADTMKDRDLSAEAGGRDMSSGPVLTNTVGFAEQRSAQQVRESEAPEKVARVCAQRPAGPRRAALASDRLPPTAANPEPLRNGSAGLTAPSWCAGNFRRSELPWSTYVD